MSEAHNHFNIIPSIVAENWDPWIQDHFSLNCPLESNKEKKEKKEENKEQQFKKKQCIGASNRARQ